MTSSRNPIETPCIGVCAVDAVAGLCIGCGRSLQEIAQWTRLAPEERRRVMSTLPQRLAHHADRPNHA